jgi:hypothetical protein
MNTNRKVTRDFPTPATGVHVDNQLSQLGGRLKRWCVTIVVVSWNGLNPYTTPVAQITTRFKRNMNCTFHPENHATAELNVHDKEFDNQMQMNDRYDG